jgi:hypothetical protein
MKEYAVTFVIKPAVRIDPRIQNIDFTFKEPDGTKRVIISKIEEEVGQQKIQTGLFLRVFLNANSVKEARENAKSFADGVVSFITLVSGAGLQVPLENLAYEVTQEADRREFLQVFYDILKVQFSRRRLDHELLTKIIDRTLKLDSSSYYSVARTIRWYRMGALTFDIFDKFNCFWIGLEALNPVLQRKLSVGNDPRKCPKCGYEWVATTTLSGVRTFMHKLQDGSRLYRRCHDLRVAIMHSTQPLSKILGEAKELTPKIAEALFRAICFVIDMENWNSLPYKPILENVPMRMEVEGNLVGGTANSLGPNGEDPHLEPSHDLLPVRIEDDGSITFEGQSKFDVHISSFVKFEGKEIRFYGDYETKGSIKEIKVEHAVK